MTRLLVTTGMFLTSTAFPAFGQDIVEKPDLAAIARAGQASVKRFQRDSASWTTTTATPAGILCVVEFLATPSMRRSVLSVEFQGRREQFARIIQKGGVWYSDDASVTAGRTGYQACSRAIAAQ
jgi:hypothetical protein